MGTYELLSCTMHSVHLNSKKVVKDAAYVAVVTLDNQHYSSGLAYPSKQNDVEWNTEHLIVLPTTLPWPHTLRATVFQRVKDQRIALGTTTVAIDATTLAATTHHTATLHPRPPTLVTTSPAKPTPTAAPCTTPATTPTITPTTTPATTPPSAAASGMCNEEAGGPPTDTGPPVGTLELQLGQGDERRFMVMVWTRLLGLADIHKAGVIDEHGFIELMEDVGCELTLHQLSHLHAAAGQHADGQHADCQHASSPALTTAPPRLADCHTLATMLVDYDVDHAESTPPTPTPTPAPTPTPTPVPTPETSMRGDVDGHTQQHGEEEDEAVPLHRVRGVQKHSAAFNAIATAGTAAAAAGGGVGGTTAAAGTITAAGQQRATLWLLTRCFICGEDLGGLESVFERLAHVHVCTSSGAWQHIQDALQSADMDTKATSKWPTIMQLSEWLVKPTRRFTPRAIKRVVTGKRQPPVAPPTRPPAAPPSSSTTTSTRTTSTLTGAAQALEADALGTASYTYDTVVAAGKKLGLAAPVLYVYNRHSKKIEVEIIPTYLLVAMRDMYATRVGRTALKNGGYKVLNDLSVRQGRWANSPESAQFIPKFIEGFKDQILMDDVALPISDFKNFNQFFYRKLTPFARPIAAIQNHDVVVSAADCRLTTYTTVTDATRCWVKGHSFSIAGLLGDSALAGHFTNGAMAIFRLAPQDYHRFHFPLSGTVRSITNIPGRLYTVNPVAINSKVDVFGENKRAVVLIENPVFGVVAFVAVGATVVGSIVFTAEVGNSYTKGDDMGYFAFGGSTCILLLPQSTIVWDADLTTHSEQRLETLVRMGERIGVCVESALATGEPMRSSFEDSLSLQLELSMLAQPSMVHMMSSSEDGESTEVSRHGNENNSSQENHNTANA